MTVTISKPAMALREELAALRQQVARSQIETFIFTGNGSLTTFALPKGWKPKAVYSAGLRKTLGVSWDYTVSFNGFVYSVVFAVAPGVVPINIDAQRV